MKKITKEFVEKLKELKIKYNVPEAMDDKDVVLIDWISAQKQSYRILIFIEQENVAMRIFSVVDVVNEKKNQVLELCNRLNNKYRWVKFALDDNNEITVQIDGCYKEDNAADICIELTMLMVRIMNEAFPEILQEIYA